MFIEKIAIFILFLGPLVFFHELGHFLFARLFGVRVEVFSIGFGPKIFKWKRGDTEYALSLIPLGGYVKMFGDDPLNKDQIPEADKAHSFTHKGKWARFWIVMGGPLANFIMAFVIFFGLMMIGEKLPELKVGVVPVQSTLYEAGLRTGDVLKKVNNQEIYNPADIVLADPQLIETLHVERNGSEIPLAIKMNGEELLDEVMEHPPLLRQPIVVGKSGEKYGLSTSQGKFDVNHSLDLIAESAVERAYLYPIVNAEEFTVNLEQETVVDFQNNSAPIDFFAGLYQKGFAPLDLLVREINIGSAADKAGIRKGDVIAGFAGNAVMSFSDLRDRLQKNEENTAALTIWKGGNELSYDVKPDVQMVGEQKLKLIGVYSDGAYQNVKFVTTASKGLIGSFLAAFPRTWDTILKTLEGFKKLITAEVSLKTIGGPLAIGKVAHDSFNTSISYFFQLMALISINLGVINLFPIPVLDGGHIMFIFLEVINRGPVSRRKMEIAQQLGLSVLLMLMVGAIFNDFSRFF